MLLNNSTTKTNRKMKYTQMKTSKQNKQLLKTLDADDVMRGMRDGCYAEPVKGLREFLMIAGEHSRYKYMYRLPVVLPSVQMQADDSGVMVMRRFNGVLTVSVGPLLADDSQVEEVRNLVQMMPSTEAVFLGSSAKTLKVIVAVCRPDGTLPQTEDEAETFCQRAYPIVCRLYESFLHMTPRGRQLTVRPAVRPGSTSLLRAGFRATADTRLFARTATPAVIHEELCAEAMPDMPTPPAPTDASPSENTIGRETRELIRLMDDRYAFRMNTVMGYVEYHRKGLWHYGWQPVDERVQNTLAMEARIEGLNVWDKDVNRYLKSMMVTAYNPVEDFLWKLRGQWDGRDHIGRLARTVPTANSHWTRWFRTWFLGMVAQWTGKNRRYGNAIAPLLISRQGYNKSTFCKSLLPPELQWGYNDSLVLTEKKAVLQAMSQFLLINLDEFNQISPQMQQGFLKNLIQQSSVKVKRPYGKHVENMPRLASFIATANLTDILADPSGNRRFIGIELTGPIDVSQRVNYAQLYAQALALLDKGEPCWLDDEQTRLVMESNRQYQLRSPEEIFFRDLFDITDNEKEGQWMSTTAIFTAVRRKAGTALRGGNIRAFGRMLANTPGITRRRTYAATEYLVRPLP